MVERTRRQEQSLEIRRSSPMGAPLRSGTPGKQWTVQVSGSRVQVSGFRVQGSDLSCLVLFRGTNFGVVSTLPVKIFSGCIDCFLEPRRTPPPADRFSPESDSIQYQIRSGIKF